MGEIAILHAADARAFACRLSSELAAEGHSVLRREGGAPGGGPDPATRAEAVVVVWSPGMLKNPPMIEAARRALARRALAPVRIGGVEPPSSFAHLWPIDLDGWNGDTQDPRWQFVRDEIALAMRRSEIALSTAQIVRPPALRRLSPRLPSEAWPALGAVVSRGPARFVASSAAGLAALATIAVMVSAQRSGANAPSGTTPLVAYVEPARPQAEAPPERPLEVPAPPLRGESRPAPEQAPDPPGSETIADVFAESAFSFPDGAGGPDPSLATGAPDIPAPATEPAAAESDGPVEPIVVASLEAPPAAPEQAPLPVPPKDDYAGLVFRDCYDCPDMTPVPAANVALSRREVTFDQWAACVRDDACRPAHDGGFGRGGRPVVNITHEDARRYAAWLSGKTGWTYRLPTEAEWALAAAADTDPASPTAANYAASPWKGPLPAGSFKASAYGLFDMRGNVWEWTADCGAEEGGVCTARVLKGGAFDSAAASLAPNARSLRGERARAVNIGLRVARETP
ncbi:MAG: SUMF1/EgtB/PvdO family nonheme iron enzyme [Parvularculaceae bacterium]|nr:SUMF1/EgtB/PvdO family nonheme iron enzyme [Parvularculaceae bacterium]